MVRKFIRIAAYKTREVKNGAVRSACVESGNLLCVKRTQLVHAPRRKSLQNSARKMFLINKPLILHSILFRHENCLL